MINPMFLKWSSDICSSVKFLTSTWGDLGFISWILSSPPIGWKKENKFESRTVMIKNLRKSLFRLRDINKSGALLETIIPNYGVKHPQLSNTLMWLRGWNTCTVTSKKHFWNCRKMHGLLRQMLSEVLWAIISEFNVLNCTSSWLFLRIWLFPIYLVIYHAKFLSIRWIE